MGFKPFQTIAGNSLGGVSPRDFLVDILEAVTDEIGFSETHEFYVDLAKSPDDSQWLNNEAFDQFVTMFNDFVNLPAFCQLEIRDNEAIILPMVESALEDEGTTTTDSLPGDYVSDYVAVVNDHGNVDFYEWKTAIYHSRSMIKVKSFKPQYDLVWSVI